MKASHILDIMRYFKMIPLSVQQRVIALHPETRELKTAKILTAALNVKKTSSGSMYEPL